MEGLLPYIYRTLRRSRRSSQYIKDACPSAGGSQWFGRSTSGLKLARPPPITLGKFSTGAGASDDDQASSESVYFFSSRAKDGGGRSGSSPGLFACLSPRTHEV